MSPRRVQPAPERDTLLTIPNLITFLRILLIIPFVQAVTAGNDTRAVIIFFIAGVTDAFDGVLARALNQTSKFGRLVDPVADKVLAGIAYVAMSLFRGPRPAVPIWIMAVVLTRDALILLGCAFIYWKAHTTAFRPSFAGKFNTVVELNLIGLFLVACLYPPISPLLPAYYVVFAVSIVVSFTGYVRQGIAMLRDAGAAPSCPPGV